MILLFQDALTAAINSFQMTARQRTADCHLAEQLSPIERQRGGLGLNGLPVQAWVVARIAAATRPPIQLREMRTQAPGRAAARRI